MKSRTTLEEVFRAEGIYLKVGNRQILENIGLNLFRGELLGVVGTFHSGIGYLKKILLGELLPQRGQFYLRGNAVVLSDKRSLHIGRITIDSCLAEGMTVAENLYLISRLKPNIVNWRAMNRYINSMLSTIAPFIRAEQVVRSLSAVEKKIVEIMKYALMDVSVILIDDNVCYTEKANLMLYQAIRAFCAKGMSFVCFANHSNCFAENADRVLIFRSNHVTGYVINDGPEKPKLQKMISPELASAVLPETGRDVFREKNLYRISYQNGADWQEIPIRESEIVCFLSNDHEFIRTLETMFETISHSYTKNAVAKAHDVNWKLERLDHRKITFMPYHYFESIICKDLSVYDNAFLNYRPKGIANKAQFWFRGDNYFSRQVEEVLKKPAGYARENRSHDLSRHEQWRLLTFRNFIGSTKTIFMSYPTKEAVSVLQIARKKQISVIIATDSAENIFEKCDKVLAVEYGRVVKELHSEKGIH